MPPTKIVITKNREISQRQAASPPPLRTTYVNARFRIHKTSQTVSAATLSPPRIYIIAFSNLFYNKITRLFAFYISVFRVFAPYPHALRPLRPCDKKPPRPKPRRRSGFCGTNDPRRARSAPTPRREPCRRAEAQMPHTAKYIDQCFIKYANSTVYISTVDKNQCIDTECGSMLEYKHTKI